MAWWVSTLHHVCKTLSLQSKSGDQWTVKRRTLKSCVRFTKQIDNSLQNGWLIIVKWIWWWWHYRPETILKMEQTNRQEEHLLDEEGWKEEAQAVIQDIQEHVTLAVISSQLQVVSSYPTYLFGSDHHFHTCCPDALTCADVRPS